MPEVIYKYVVLLMFSYLFIFHTRQIHFHWVEWPDLSLSRVSILHKMAVRLMIRRFWHLMVTVHSALKSEKKCKLVALFGLNFTNFLRNSGINQFHEIFHF